MKNIKRQIKFNPVAIIFISLLTIVSCQKEESEYEKRVKIDDNTINEYLTDNGAAGRSSCGTPGRPSPPSSWNQNFFGWNAVDFRRRRKEVDRDRGHRR